MAKEKSIEVDGVIYTESSIRNSVRKAAVIAKAAQDYLTYTSAVNGIPPRPEQVDLLRDTADCGQALKAYWALFDALHPDQAK